MLVQLRILFLTFDYFSDPGTYTTNPFNKLIVEHKDTSGSWVAIDSFQQATTQWDSLGLYLGNIVQNGTLSLRFRAESGGSSGDYYNDLLVDQVRVLGLTNVGCTDPVASNYDPTAIYDDASCIYLLGCTDMLAANYDSTATSDDGSCLYPGCLDRFANNYCASCNSNDSLSCTYNQCNVLPFDDNF